MHSIREKLSELQDAGLAHGGKGAVCKGRVQALQIIEICNFKVWIESMFGYFLAVTFSKFYDFVSVSSYIKRK